MAESLVPWELEAIPQKPHATIPICNPAQGSLHGSSPAYFQVSEVCLFGLSRAYGTGTLLDMCILFSTVTLARGRQGFTHVVYQGSRALEGARHPGAHHSSRRETPCHISLVPITANSTMFQIEGDSLCTLRYSSGQCY